MAPLRVVGLATVVSTLSVALWAAPRAAAEPSASPERSDIELYQAACASCHGLDGTGAPSTQVVFDVPLPDFTDCSFASREPDSDWGGVAAEGGPLRGFSEIMPAFGDALTPDEVSAVLGHIRTLCDEERWPSGELNLPYALYTSKAFPEDELVVTSTIEGSEVTSAVTYEKRFGARHNVEVKVPWHVREDTESGTVSSGLGDVAVAVKSAVAHSASTGSILALVGEVVLPVGDLERGFGKGHTVLEPFVAYGQILPADSFLQVQAGAEIPVVAAADQELFWRAALGKSFTQGDHGRAWTPMVEVLGGLELAPDTAPDWAVVPQLHLTLNTRQHVMLLAGARFPLTDVEDTPVQVRLALLWDWFDGGITEGW